jgi:hypothetical protein
MNLYEQVVAEVQQVLPKGQDAGNFVARQCSSHLNVEPSALSVSQISELARWIGVSASLLIPKDQALALGQKIAGLH